MSEKYIHFHNDTDLPVMVDSWVDGAKIMQYTRIGPREKQIIHSSVGQWTLNARLYNQNDHQKWVDKGLGNFTTIGIIRSKPTIHSKQIAWMEWNEPFECIYNEDFDESDVKGLITFIQK